MINNIKNIILSMGVAFEGVLTTFNV